MKRTYKYRIYPTLEQEEKLLSFLHSYNIIINFGDIINSNKNEVVF